MPIIILGKIFTKSVNFLPIIVLRKIESNFVEINPFPLSSAIVVHDQAYMIIIDIVATFTLLCPYVPQITSPGSLLVPFIFDILPLPYCFHMCHKSIGSPPCPVHFDTLTISNA